MDRGMDDIKQAIRDLTQTTSGIALTVNSLQQITREQHERIKRLEDAPKDLRGALTSYGGCLAYLVSAAIAGLAVLVSIVALVMTITHG